MQQSQSRQSIFVELAKSLIPITPMGRAMLIGVAVWFVNWIFSGAETLFGSQALKTLIDFLSALALIPLVYFAFQAARAVTAGLLWRLRRRLIVTYLLIGALPLLLLLVLVALVGWVVVMQSSASLVERQLESYLEQSRAAARALSRDLSDVSAERWQPAVMSRRLQERADALAPMFPNITLKLRQESGLNLTVKGVSPEGVQAQNEFVGVDTNLAADWMSAQEFHGFVVEENFEGERRIFARHVIRLAAPPQAMFQLSYPIGDGLCERLFRTTDLKILPGQARVSLMMTPAGGKVDESEPGIAPQPSPDQVVIPTGIPIFKPVIEWRTGIRRERDVLMIDSAFLSPGSIWQRVQRFKSSSTFGSALYVVIASLAFVFFLIALAAVVSAIVLTRSITGAVHYLYQGTQKVEAGDFEHEIKIGGKDQLASLSGAFNQMTRSIRDLLRVSAEKQRLDQEMKIAAEVQARLFPRSTPKTTALDFANGVCIPARSVSGDYYDFLQVAPGVIGVVVADVCGKGVSAALMMANLQANLRGQVQVYHDTYDQAYPIRRIVERVNQQVAESVMDSSFITFFYAEFDERRRVLRYVNAGHNPPLLVRAKKSDGVEIERLDRGGTVLGLFCDAEFEDAELQLESGDVLAAFTDGLIEARSPDGEEFGEERLIDCLTELTKNHQRDAASIEREILRAVKTWTHDSEQEDDLTLVVFKVAQR
ncbi:MAG: PP2C family protein-serine/threonine phosphatase [Acidobacteriota bacterium]|nr:PP2C family protein-serine/threonine phosphatase [Acidobacteriota bacterium]